MNKQKIDKHKKNQYDKLPRNWVFYALEGDHGFLSCGYSANLKRRLKSIQSKVSEGGIYREMWEKAATLHWQSHKSGIEALIHYKCFLSRNYPEFQSQTMPWADYVYLALDAYNYPFISITGNTQGEALYVGPFRNRFRLIDQLDIFARILKLPQCETGSYPCNKYDLKNCRGWCLNLEEKQSAESIPSLDKLDSLLKEGFIHPENGILELVSKQKDEYFNALEFAKASLLDDELELLAQYRDWLKFLYVAKQMQFSNPDLQVENGRIASCSFEGENYHFPVDKTPYRKNESLALDLAYVDESRIIYEYLMTMEN